MITPKEHFHGSDLEKIEAVYGIKKGYYKLFRQCQSLRRISAAAKYFGFPY